MRSHQCSKGCLCSSVWYFTLLTLRAFRNPCLYVTFVAWPIIFLLDSLSIVLWNPRCPSSLGNCCKAMWCSLLRSTNWARVLFIGPWNVWQSNPISRKQCLRPGGVVDDRRLLVVRAFMTVESWSFACWADIISTEVLSWYKLWRKTLFFIITHATV